VNQSNLVRTFTITNSGSAALGVGTVSAGGDFTITDQPSSPIAVGATDTFSVQFDPSAAGLRTATVTFTNNVSGGKGTYTFSVHGTGVLAGIARSPTTINITAMVGTTNANQNFGVTNVGLGRLDYTLSSNVNWLSVSPSDGQLAQTAGQQHTVRFNLAGLSAGTSNATITINSSGASNDGQTVSVVLTLTNIPSLATLTVTNDGKELNRVSWVKLGAFDTMVVYRGTNAPSTPSQGASYNVGGAVGSDGSHVVYKGGGTNFEHVAGAGRIHYYAFYAITNNHYSPAVTGSVTTTSYGAGEIVDPMAYTNAATLHGMSNGAGWTSAWSVGSGVWTGEFYSLNVETNYPASSANKIRMANPGDGGQSHATRSFAPVTAGQIYVGWIMSYQYQEDYKFAGLSLMSNAVERAFIGKIPDASWRALGVSRAGNSTDTKRSSPEYELNDFNTSTGNIYLIVATYDFGTRDLKAKAFYKTTEVPYSEPVSWDVTSNFPPGHITLVNGIRLTAGALGGGDGTIGQVRYDEVRVATNWSELLGVVASPEIAVLGTNHGVIADGTGAASAATGTEFGPALASGGTVDRTFYITNSGAALLTISGVATAGSHAADFVILSYPGAVMPGTRSNFVVRFAPGADGTRSATLIVTNNDADEAVYDFAVQGTGQVPPTVTTTVANPTNLTTATAGGNVTADGYAAVTNRGVVWGLSALPAVPGAQTTNGTGTGVYTSTLTNLAPGAVYYYRAFAQNAAGTGYGTQYTLTTPCFAGIVTGLHASATNDLGFTAAWSNFADATGYALDVATNAAFAGGPAITELFFSEYVEGSSNNKFLEIYNGTGASVDLGDYRVLHFNNGASTPTYSLTLSGTLAAGDVYVIENNSESLGVSADLSTSSQVMTFNGDDAIALTNVAAGHYADIIGQIGTDPGSEWGSGNASTADNTIRRMSTITAGDTDGTDTFTPSDEWDGYATDTVSDLGSHTVAGGASYVAGYSNRAVAATSATVTGLTAGVTYYFRVRATNEYCTTGDSATGSVTTIVLAPDVAVYGNGTLIADGDSVPDPADLTDFGRVGLIGSNLVHAFTITNSGAGTLVFGNVTTSGVSDFVVISQPTNPLASHATTTFQVRFDPQAVGTRTATLQFTNNVAAKSPYDFVVRGTGVAAGFLRSPASINVTSMLGSAPPTANFGVTNVGLGQLVYTLSTNAAWLSVSPSGATLAETAGQQHTVTFNAAGLGVGVSNATITLSDANASNDAQQVSVAWTITNIPLVTANLATNDGAELVRVSWTAPPALDVLILHRGTNPPAGPVQGTAYTNGQLVGSDGSRVVYRGSGSYLDHLPGLAQTNVYVFHAINNNYYSPGVTSVAVTASYGAQERVEPFAYTNGVSLAGLAGGNLFTSAWTIGAGNFTVLSNGPNPNLAVNTNYPAPVAQRVVVSNYVNDTEMRAARRFAAVSSGAIYLTFQMAVEYGGAGKYTGIRLMSNTTERLFVGETGGNDVLGIDGHGGGVANSGYGISSWQSDTGNVYLVVARYIFSSNQVAVKGYYRTDAVPEAEPTSWDITATAGSDRTYVDGIELVSGGFNTGVGNQPGLTSFDEIRIATNWAAIVPPSGQPGIGIGPTNITVTVMRGSNPAAQTFGVTNIGAGVLAYDVSTNFSWVTVSPVAGNLAGGVGQSHTVTLNTAALPPGTNLATITITAATATNSPRLLPVAVIVTNIPPPENVVAYADGYEMVRLGWDPPAGLQTLILHDDNPIATDPSHGIAYDVDDPVGVAKVIYAGGGDALEHVVLPGSTNYYAFYSVNGSYYSSASTNTTMIECPDPAATNLVAGDIAIFGLNTLTGGGTNNDSFGFLPLLDLPTGTQIKFTDNGWRNNGTFRTGEGILTWRATSCVPAGTIIRWVGTNTPQVTVGAIVQTNGSFEPNIQGEQVLAYQGPETNPVFLYALASHTTGVWDADSLDSHSSALPTGLTNGYTAVVIYELNNVVLNTNQLTISGDRNAILTFIGSTNNWIGSDSEVFDLLAYDFTFPDINSSGGGVMTSLVMGVYRTNEIVDAFAYTNGVAMNTPSRGGGWGWTQAWTGAVGTWTALSNEHGEVSFPDMPNYPTNAANALKVANPGVNSTGTIERGFAPVTNGSFYFSTFVAYQYEGTRKFAGISLLSGGVETGFIGKVSDNSHSFTFGIDTYGGAQQFAAFDLRGLENSTNNTYLVIGRYDFSTKELRGLAYYRTDTVPTSEPAYWAVTATVSGAGIPVVDGVALRAGADMGGAVGDAYFDEVRVATSWGALINRNPPTVETRPITNVQPASAVGGGDVTSDGGLTVTNRGVVWSTNAVPTLADNVTSDGTGAGLYSSTLSVLVPGGTYYVRAYAQNAAGTSYGGISNFTALCFTSVVLGVHANPTNSVDFTANWTALTGALGYELDVSQSSNFTGSGGSYGSEPFTNVGGGTVSSYLTRQWTNNGVGWTAYKARTDQTIDSSEALTFQDDAGAYIVSDAITGGVSALSVRHQRKFGSGSGTFDIFVNSVKVATNVTYDANVGTARVENINVSGTFTLSISNAGSQRLAVDDFAWTNAAGMAGSFLPGYDGRSVAGTSQIVTGLTEGATYYFRVRALGAGSCESENSATGMVRTVDTVGPALSDFGVNAFTNTTLTDFQLAHAITVTVQATDGGGVNWNGATITPPNLSPFFSITNPAGVGIVAPVAFNSSGHVDGENPSVMTGVVTASSVTTGEGFRTFITLADHSFTNTRSHTNFFTVIDDDGLAPTLSSADITYGGFGGRYFSITTNASPALIDDRGGTFTTVVYRLTDGDLNEAAARDLRFAFGVRDADSGLLRGTAGTTNTVLNFSVGNVIVGNFTNYRADLSSANYTNARTTNVWTFPAGFFTENIITTLMSVASNAVAITAPDDDNDRANDTTTLYDALVGWITVLDDDTAGPVLSALSINGAAGAGVTNVFVETMGTTGTSGDSIAVHESNNRFDNDAQTMSGSGDVRNTSASSGSDYGEASGGFNVMLNTAGETFEIAGIDVSAYSGLTLAFGVRKSATAEDGSGLTVQVSSNGAEWVTLTIPPLPTGTGTATWYARTNTAGTIPSAPSLYIRFSSSNTVEWRLDDVRLIATLSQVQLTDGQVAFGGYAITTLVQDAYSGVTVSNAFHPYYVLYNTNGAAVVSNGLRTAFANGTTSQQPLSTNAAAAASTNLVTLGTNLLYVFATDADNDRSNDRASSTSAPLAVLVVDDDTNAPVASGFQLAGGLTNFDLSVSSIALTGLVTDASGFQSPGSHFVLLDNAGAVAQSNVLGAGAGSAATGTIFSAGLFCGQVYTIRVYVADADLDRPEDHLAVTSVAVVIQTTGVGGPADYPLASNLLVNGSAAAPALELYDQTLRTGGWSVAMAMSHPVGVFTNAASPYFRLTNGVGEAIGPTPFSNAVLSGTTYYFTNNALPAVPMASVATGLHFIVWSASNQGSCVAEIVDRDVITGGTNVFMVVDEDAAGPSLADFTLEGGQTTVSIAAALSGFSITGSVADAGSGVAFTSQPPYFLFHALDGSVLASNTYAGGSEGAGLGAPVPLTNWFSGLTLSCGNSYTIVVVAADADADRMNDRSAVTNSVLVLVTEGEDGDAPTAADLLVNNTAASSVSLFDETISTGGWKVALTMTHASGGLVTNGPTSPSFLLQNSSGAHVYATAPLTWTSIVKVGANYYATNTPMPAAQTNLITTGTYSLVWSAQSDGLCFGVTNGSGVVSPGTNRFLVVDDDTVPPNLYGLSVAGGSGSGGPGAGDCPDATATNLQAGDIALLALNTKTVGVTNNDGFAFVTLVDLPTGTQIKFTDNGWKSSTASFRNNEGTLTWMATSCVPAGSVVRWIATNAAQLNLGRIVVTNGSFAPNIQGEQILAYQGSDSSPNFIYALNDRLNGIWDVDSVDSHSSAIPPGLIDGYTAVAVGEFDNVILNTNNLAITGDREQILYYIGDRENWIGSDTEVYDLLQFNFTFPDANAGGGVITDQDILLGTWGITGLVQDVGSGVLVSNEAGLRYAVWNTNGGLVVSNYFSTTFTNASKALHAFSNNAAVGAYAFIQLGTYTAQILAADADADRAYDQAERMTNVPFTVVDDDTDYPQIGSFFMNGQTTITNPAELTSVVLSGQVRDVTSGIAFSSQPPSFEILDSLGAVALAGSFDYGPTAEGAGTGWTNIWTTNLNLTGIADCGTYTVRVTIADADDDRPDDRRSTNLLFFINMASGSGAPPTATNLLVNATPAGLATLTDQDAAAGGWSLAVSLKHPTGVKIDPPDTPSFIVRNAATVGVVTQLWSNIVTVGNVLFATNAPMPTIPYAQVDTGYYTVVWSARSQGACFGETNNSATVDGDTNRFLVVDDDTAGPPAPTNVVSSARDWTNLTVLAVTWHTSHVTDASVVAGFRVTTNHTVPVGVTDGVFVGYTNATAVTNLPEGIRTNWVFAYDSDNDRVNDAARGAITSFVTYIDRTPPAQVAGLTALPGFNDNTSEIDMNWTPAADAGNPALSPWYSYRVFYTDALTGPTPSDPSWSLADGLTALGTNTTSGITVGGLTFDTTYRIAIACVDRAGNMGPLSATQVVTLGSFLMTQGLVRTTGSITNQQVELSWTAASGKDYDTIYVDSDGFRDNLTNHWNYLATVSDSWLNDTGAAQRTHPYQLGGNTMRFYRASLAGKWTMTTQPQRVASREVYVAKPLVLKEGHNLVSLFMTPDTNRVASILGTNRLPAGGSMIETSTVVSFYGASTGGMPKATTWWLSNAGRWMYSTGGVADNAALPLYEGFNIFIPEGEGTQRLMVVGRVPISNAVVQISGGSRAAPVYNVVSYTVPRRATLAELKFKEAGLVGHSRPDYADEIRIMRRGWGSLEEQPKVRLRLNGLGDWLYMSYSEEEYPSGPPTPPTSLIVEPDEAIIVIRRTDSAMAWTNHLYYTPPGRNINP